MARLPRIGTLALLGTTFALSPVLAQQPAPEPERNVTVEERRRPQFDPIGIRAGGFLIFPSVQVGTEYDSNAFATEKKREDDFALLVRPRITAVSQWSRHALNASLFGDFGFYKEFDENNYQDFGAAVNGRLDVTRDDKIFGNLSLARRHQGRESPEDIGVGDLVTYVDGLAALGYRKDFNLIYVSVGASVNRLDYSDENNFEDQRDRIEYGTDLRIGYKVSPRFNLFVQGDYTIVRYDLSPDKAGFDRDSKGFGVSAGVDVDITGILFGEASFGYIRRTYDDDDLDSVSGPGGLVRLTWNPTGLTSVILEGSSAVIETTQFGASSNLQTNAGVEVQHELLRNLILNGRLSFTRDDFQGIDRTDHTFRIRAGARYLLNRNVSLDGSYEFATRDSDVAGGDYDRHLLRLGLTARL